jgi:hypothetical protein
VNRRQFLQTSAGTGVALFGNVAAAAGSPMFVALNNTLLNGKVQWPESARLAAKVGYGGTGVNLGAAMKEGLNATRALFAETKLKPWASDEAFQKGMETLDEQVKCAAAIGCNRMMVVIPPATPTPRAELRRWAWRSGNRVGDPPYTTAFRAAASSSCLSGVSLAPPAVK